VVIFPPIVGEMVSASATCRQLNSAFFTRCRVEVPEKIANVSVEQIDELRATVRVPADLLEGVNNVFLRMSYVGDIGNCFLNGKLIADNFNNGTIWEIGLKHLLSEGNEAELFFLITPLRVQGQSATYVPTGMAFRADNGVEQIGEIQSVWFVPEYKYVLDIVE
jgi:hypothetical protein